MWRALAATGLVLAGLTGLGYAGWLLTARRAVFADIAAVTTQGGAVSLEEARSSDALNAGWLAATLVLLAVALALWAATWLATGRRLGPVGFVGASMVAVGALVTAAGSVLASASGADPAAADQVATGCSVFGVGFLLVSLGLLTGMASLLRGEPDDGAPYLGYAGWNAG